jgi:hypothetical protein
MGVCQVNSIDEHNEIKFQKNTNQIINKKSPSKSRASMLKNNCLNKNTVIVFDGVGSVSESSPRQNDTVLETTANTKSKRYSIPFLQRNSLLRENSDSGLDYVHSEKKESEFNSNYLNTQLEVINENEKEFLNSNNNTATKFYSPKSKIHLTEVTSSMFNVNQDIINTNSNIKSLNSKFPNESSKFKGQAAKMSFLNTKSSLNYNNTFSSDILNDQPSLNDLSEKYKNKSFVLNKHKGSSQIDLPTVNSKVLDNSAFNSNSALNKSDCYGNLRNSDMILNFKEKRESISSKIRRESKSKVEDLTKKIRSTSLGSKGNNKVSYSFKYDPERENISNSFYQNLTNEDCFNNKGEHNKSNMLDKREVAYFESSKLPEQTMPIKEVKKWQKMNLFNFISEKNTLNSYSNESKTIFYYLFISNTFFF